MKMISMENVKEENSPMALTSSSDKPKYPYGLSINLCDDVLKALGMKNLPNVGQSLKMECVVEVCSVSQYENQDGAEVSLSLQITEMALEQPKKASKEVLYDKE